MTSKAAQSAAYEQQAKKKRIELHRGKILSFATDTLTYPNGEVKTFELALHPGAVVMLPVDDSDHLIFVQQWRRGASCILTEFPAGTLEPGEDPATCAQRELQEEIGMRAAHLVPLGGFFTAPSFCSEYLYLFLATGLTADPLTGEDTAAIDCVKAPLPTVMRWVEDKKITDAKTLAGLCYYRNWLETSTKKRR